MPNSTMNKTEEFGASFLSTKTGTKRFVYLLIIICLSSTTSLFAPSLFAETLDFAVLNMKGAKETTISWKPLADYIAENCDVDINFLTLKNQSVMVRAIDTEIILTNPVSTILLQEQGGFEIIATVKDNVLGSLLAGLIIVHKDSNIENLSDLANRKIGVVNRSFAAGGFLFQTDEIIKNGLDPALLLTNLSELFNQRAIIRRVNSRELDVGFIRTGMLANLRGKEASNNIRIINRLNAGEKFPRSTSLHPNWALSVKREMNLALKEKISRTILAIKPTSEVAIMAGIQGFVSPLDYSLIRTMVLRLDKKTP